MFKKFNEIYHFIDEFKEADLNKLDSKISLIYRNYEKKVDVSLIKKIKNYCKKKNKKFYLANNTQLSYNLNLDGVYIPSFNRSVKHNSFKRKKNFKVLGSAHNIKEILIKEKQNVDSIFISPIFKNQKQKKILGIYRFLILKKITKKKVIGLGGINKLTIKKLRAMKCDGFASISLIKTLYNETRR